MNGSITKRLLALVSISLLTASSMNSMIKKEKPKPKTKKTGCCFAFYKDVEEVTDDLYEKLEKIGNIKIKVGDNEVTISAIIAEKLSEKLKAIEAVALHILEDLHTAATTNAPINQNTVQTLVQNGITTQAIKVPILGDELKLSPQFSTIIQSLISKIEASKEFACIIKNVESLIEEGIAFVEKMLEKK